MNTSVNLCCMESTDDIQDPGPIILEIFSPMNAVVSMRDLYIIY